MSIPTKGRRRVRVDAREYAWRIRKKPTYAQGIAQSPMRIEEQVHERIDVDASLVERGEVDHRDPERLFPQIARADDHDVTSRTAAAQHVAGRRGLVGP